VAEQGGVAVLLAHIKAARALLADDALVTELQGDPDKWHDFTDDVNYICVRIHQMNLKRRRVGGGK
jgi:hypothetical protein